MINEFGAKNFFGFKDWAVVSCLLDTRVPKNIRNGLSVSPVMGIKGANASGKTNILKIFNFIRSFILDGALSESASKSADEKYIDRYIDVTSFYNSREASEFFINFNYKDRTFEYALSVTREEVIEESLDIVNRGRLHNINIFKRNRDNLEVDTKFAELKKLKLGKNISLIRQASSFNFNFEDNVFEDIKNFFNMSWTNVDNEGIQQDRSNDLRLIEFLSGLINVNPDIRDFVLSIVKRSDLGVSDIVIEKNINSKGEEIHIPYFIHEHEDQKNRLPFFLESNGTRKLFTSLAYYWLVLRSGGILLLDEFDIHLHPLILPIILDLFMDVQYNKKDAQFIFTSHNTEIMDILGKYRTILVEKKDNESYCYRMDEIEGLRNDRNNSSKYLRGDFGGIPIIKDE